MGTIHGSGWKCPKCGHDVIRQHCQDFCSKIEGRDDDWCTKAEREADPALKAIAEERMKGMIPCMWVDDPTWMTCNECGYELTAPEREMGHGVLRKFFQNVKEGKAGFREEYGIAILNKGQAINIAKKKEIKP